MSTSKADSTDSYIFGDDDVELKRLKDQDKDVNEYTVDVISRLGIKPGSRVLDLACGPGFVSINHLRYQILLLANCGFSVQSSGIHLIFMFFNQCTKAVGRKQIRPLTVSIYV